MAQPIRAERFSALFRTAFIRKSYSAYLTVSLINHIGCTRSTKITRESETIARSVAAEEARIEVVIGVALEGREAKIERERRKDTQCTQYFYRGHHEI